jgi:Derlin-2/3
VYEIVFFVFSIGGSCQIFYFLVHLDFVFHIFFMVRYSRMLEGISFRNRSADFLYMLLFGAGILCIIGPYVKLYFLSSALTFMMVYVWARRNPYVRMSFLGLFNFNAPYLPWVLLVFSLCLNNALPIVDLLGIVVGHFYYFLEDIYPRITGQRLLYTPKFLKRWIDGPMGEPSIHPSEDERAEEHLD